MIENKLPKELKSLVRITTTLLGEVLREEEGKPFLNHIENIRQMMKSYRTFKGSERVVSLERLYKKLDQYDKVTKNKIARTYTFYFELINACESAYRTYRLKQKLPKEFQFSSENEIVYVLTAHPTESRTSENLFLFHQTQGFCLRFLEGQTHIVNEVESLIKHNIKLAWLIPMTKHRKPKVEDEAHHLYSIFLRSDLIESFLYANLNVAPVRVRTWVGGDKDGHPGVDEKSLLVSFNLARKRFVEFITEHFVKIQTTLDLLKMDSLKRDLKRLSDDVTKLQKVYEEDARRVKKFKNDLRKISTQYENKIGEIHPSLKILLALIDLFPGLVIPLELRESSDVIEEAFVSQKTHAIERMLEKASQIAKGGHVRCYVQGMIVSMTESADHILKAAKLMEKYMPGLPIPVIPLFETARALEQAPQIVKELLEDKKYRSAAKTYWHGDVEVMVGYSDSSKTMGVLASRLAIGLGMYRLENLIKNYGFRPVFFQGSGGSVDRGGGSIQEQTAWWPKSALRLFKSTVQGEMVERNFASSEITLSSMMKILENFQKRKGKAFQEKQSLELQEFARVVRSEFEARIKSESFIELVQKATPYSYLQALRLGSRPTKRKRHLSLSSIRAIPWVLCWTQTRVLFPTWWGIGSAWKKYQSHPEKRKKLRSLFLRSELFRSFVRVLGFTLKKVDLNIWHAYLKHSGLSEEVIKEICGEFIREFQLAKNFVMEMSGERNLLWFRPWLSQSIDLRSPYIHPLNLLQIQAFRDKDEDLIRMTVAGIAMGMLTTG